MAIENEQEVVEFLKEEKNKDFLEKNGFNTTKEVTVEKPLTIESVKGFLEGNEDIKKEISHEYLVKIAGREITEDTLKQGIFFKDDIDEAKKLTVKTALRAVKYGDLLLPKIDMNKIQFKDGEISGLDEQINNLQTTYKDLFRPGSDNNTPPSVPPSEPKTEEEKIKAQIEELSKKLTNTNRLKIMELNRQLHALKK